jgi:hypothetical protein
MIQTFSKLDRPRWVDAAWITLDDELGAMLPRPCNPEGFPGECPPAKSAAAQPFLIWPVDGYLILLIGYERFPSDRFARVPVVEKLLGDRTEARLFILSHYLAQANPSELAISYVCGLEYAATKLPPARPRKSLSRAGRRFLLPSEAGLPVSPTGKTAQALGEIFGVSPATVRRNADITLAVHSIMDACGQDPQQTKSLLLSRRARLTREGLLALAKLPAERQRDCVFQLRIHGKLPRNWQTPGPSRTITLPRQLPELADALLRKFGPEQAEQVSRLLADLVHRQRSQSNAQTGFA